MTRNLIAMVLAASVALTSVGTTPAHASARDDQLGQFIAGAIALMIIGKAIEGNRKVQSPIPTPPNKPTPPRNRPNPPRAKSILPGECQFDVRDRFGKRSVYGKRCLRDVLRPREVRLLPEQCEDRVRIREGRRANVYDARCLHQEGFRESNRRR